MYLTLLQSSTFCFFLTIVPILCSSDISPSPSVSRGSHYEDCMSSSSSSCGTSAVKIAYPFWGNGHPEYCGRPGFKLSCEGSHFTMTIMSKVYRVLNIDYNTSTLRLANEAFSQTDCPNPQALYNTTLDWTLFNYTSNVRNASVYYDCPRSPVLTGAPFSFTCTGMYSNGLSFLVVSSSWENQLDNFCQTKVYVVVYNSSVHDLFYNSSSVGDVLKEGFEVNWVIDDGQCQECFISGGYCGYDMTLDRSTCFCENGAFSTKCPTPSKGISLKAKVGVGVAAGLMGIFIILLPLFIYLRPEKDYQSSTSFTTTKDLVSSEANPEEKSGYFGTHLFSYRELQQATNNFEKSKELGQGGFGTVYHGKLRDGREVAIKRMFEKNNKQVEQFTNELEILTRLSHKHLLTLYGCTTRRSRELLLVYEYVPNGTVADHLNGKRAKPGSLSWPLRLRIAIETASALVYLHASDIIHRDVKTTNILLDGEYSVKVADFGLSRLFPLDVTHVSTTPQGSPGYVDPEYYQCYQLTDKSDVYSFGVVLAELISAKPAVDITRNRKEINLSNMAINKIKKQAWDELVDPHLGIDSNTKTKEEVIRVAELAFQCLQATKVTRPSMEEVLERLSKISSEESTVGIQDVTKDEVGVSICSSLASSNGAVESNESRKAQSMTSPSANNHDSDISVTVNVSSATI